MSLLGELFDDSGGAAEPEQLGDVVCFRWEQRAADQAIARMNAVFASLGSPATWSSAVTAVNAEWAAVDHWYRDWTLCGAKAIGQRAAQLTANMQQQAGQQPDPPDPNLQPGPSEKIGGALTLVTGAALVAGAITVAGALRGGDRERKRRR